MIEDKKAKLSTRRLEAIEEALHHRLAGHLDDTAIPRELYEGALKWAEQKRASRKEAQS